MKLYRLRRVQKLSIPMEDAWRFFSSPLNLPTITPPWMKFRNTGEVPDRMFPGMLIRYRLTPILGIPISWITEITHVDPPHSFVDEQRFGPYRFWHHHHLFRPAAEGTEMIDTVHYRLKYGILGGLAVQWLIG